MVGVGFVVVFAGFGVALAALWIAAQRVSRAPARRDRAGIVVAIAGLLTLGAFGLPAISGLTQGTLNSWHGLDPLSSVASVLVALMLVVYAALPASGDDLRKPLVVALSCGLAGTVAGNAIIQTYTERGTEAEWGLYVATATAVVAAVAALLMPRSSEPPQR